jgi:hypothetical protein
MICVSTALLLEPSNMLDCFRQAIHHRGNRLFSIVGPQPHRGCGTDKSALLSRSSLPLSFMAMRPRNERDYNFRVCEIRES